MNNPAKFIITRCGGPAVVGSMLGVSAARVHRWTYPVERGGTGGLIPTKHQAPLLQKAELAGIDLRPEHFFPARTACQAQP